MVPKVLDPRSLFGVPSVRCGNDLITPEKNPSIWTTGVSVIFGAARNAAFVSRYSFDFPLRQSP